MNLINPSRKLVPGVNAPGGPSALRHLAQYALDFRPDALPSQTLEAVQKCMLDCVAAALACLALAEEVGASHAQLIAAIVVGYDVAVRVAAGRDISRLETLSTGKWCNYGVAAASALLLGCTQEQMIQAMAIAGVHGPNQSAAEYSRVMGNHAKEGIPWSSLTGYMAVSLAVNGFTGPTDILNHPAHFEAESIVAGLGRAHAIDRVYFKPYSCCRWAHAALDALLSILETDGIGRDAVESIEIETFSRALRPNNEPEPDTLEGAQYSIPYVLGVAALYGRGALLPLTEDRLHDPGAIAFARKVQLVVDPVLDAKFPETTAARVKLRTRTGTHEREVLHPLGDPDNPMSQDKLQGKFAAVTRGMDVRAVRDGLDDFRNGSYRKLVDALGILN